MTNNTEKRLVIVDPSLKDERGHHYLLTRVITEGAKQSGYGVVWLTNTSFKLHEKSENLSVVPVFTASMYDPFMKKKGDSKSINDNSNSVQDNLRILKKYTPGILKPPLKYIRNRIQLYRMQKSKVVTNLEIDVPPKGFLGELKYAYSKVGIGTNDTILIHTADGILYRSLLDMVLKDKDFSDGPIYHVCTPYDSSIMPHNKSGLSAKEVAKYLNVLGVLDKKIFLYAENHLLANHLSEEWGVKVSALEIPPAEITYKKESSHKTDLTVVYLGAAREEKGFQMLPDVIDKVYSDRHGCKTVKFELQCSPQIVGYTPLIKEAIEKMKKYADKGVKLIDYQQSEKEYYEMLSSSDVVLICYDQSKYKVRSSGIAVEAVSFGKVVIATPDTFPAYLAKDAGIQAANSAEIAEAILNITKNKDAYLDKARKRGAEYREKTQPKYYIKKIEERVSQGSKEEINIDRKDNANGSMEVEDNKLIEIHDKKEVEVKDIAKIIEQALYVNKEFKMPKLINVRSENDSV